MRVCLVSQEFPPDTGWGGIGSYLWDLSHGLIQQGHTVHVICKGERKDSTSSSAELNIHRISHEKKALKAVPRRARGLPITFSHLAWSFSAMRYIKREIGVSNIDVIEAPETNADGFCLGGLGIPLVVKLHTPHRLHYVLNGYRDGIDVRIDDQVGRRAAMAASEIMSCSKAMKDIVVPSWKLKAESVRVVHNPIDTDKFRPLETVRQGNQKIIGYFGRLEQRKGVDTLIEAFARYASEQPDVELHLYGSDCHHPETGGTWGEWIRDVAVRAGISDRVHHKGYVGRDQLAAQYNRCAIVVIPSNQFENFPYTCLEAMSCGVPVLASRCGGLPEMVEHGESGLLVEAGNPSAFYEAFRTLFENPGRLKQFGSNARNRVENLFSTDVITGQTVQVYRDAIAKAGHNRS